MPEQAELRRKTGQRGLLMPAIRSSRKDSDRAVTPAAEAVRVPAHLAPPASPQAKHLCHFHPQLSVGRSCHRQKSLASVRTGSLWLCLTLCDPVDCGLPDFSVKEGGLQPRILVAIPFWSTIFPAALASNSPEDLELPEPPQPKQLHHLHTWPSRGQTKSSRAASGANPSG